MLAPGPGTDATELPGMLPDYTQQPREFQANTLSMHDCPLL
jgi:hypothetical protein